MVSGSGTSVTLDENLSYAGALSEGAGVTFVLSGGRLLLNGADTFAGGSVDGSNVLDTKGTTTLSGLTIGGTVEWEERRNSDPERRIGDHRRRGVPRQYVEGNLRHNRRQPDRAGQFECFEYTERRAARENRRGRNKRDRANRDQYRNDRSYCRDA
jgi:hypothetical protein